MVWSKRQTIWIHDYVIAEAARYTEEVAQARVVLKTQGGRRRAEVLIDVNARDHLARLDGWKGER